MRSKTALSLLASALCSLSTVAQNGVSPGRYNGNNQLPIQVHGSYALNCLSNISCTMSNASGTVTGNCRSHPQSAVCTAPDYIRIPATAVVSLQGNGGSPNYIANTNCKFSYSGSSILCEIMMGCNQFPNVDAASEVTNLAGGAPMQVNSSCSGVTNINQIQWLTRIGNDVNPPNNVTWTGTLTISSYLIVVW